VKLNLKDYIQGFKEKDISILARAITLIESQKSEHKEIALELISNLKVKKKSVVLGISGTPGVGKSTFIESFGLDLIDKGKSLAVLAVDPSSTVTGGSILGDKTRMSELSQKAFIRPSPSGSALGGVALKTKEAITLCECFGFDFIIIETVGVGQSESNISKLVDHFILLMQPAAGDDLQAIKRGILELADSIIVNKADGDLKNKAQITKNQLENSLEILRHRKIDIHLVSALYQSGISEFSDFIIKSSSDKKFFDKRDEQLRQWGENILEMAVLESLEGNKHYRELKTKLVNDLINNNKTAQECVELIKDGLKYGN